MSETEQASPIEIAQDLAVSRIARLGDRVFAAVLDALIPMPLLFFANTLEAIRMNAVDSDGSYSITGGPALLSMTIMLLAWMAYAVFSEFRFGGTIGKHMMGIRVRTLDRRPITLLQSLERNLFRVVDAIGLYLVGFLVAVTSDKSQRIGDRVAHTAVFETGKSDRIIPSLLGIAVFAVGIFLNAIAMHVAAGRN